ncbi:MAG: glutamate--tRNA ligase [Dehalococcoidia bacterium]|nr:glutamate--tRNA ligase [Dehalococcoidia bacterium]
MPEATERPVRVRYAPSPTGDPHVGNIRQAIWSWLYARHTGGQFYVRLEDTDQSRSVPGSLERILESLRWLGIDWDEGPDIGGPYGPYTQSERLPLYREAADRLLAGDYAYRCFCTTEELAAMRERQKAEGTLPGYWGVCRDLDAGVVAERAQRGDPHVVRFKMPREGTTTFNDLLRGDITVENRTLDDMVILKSDQFPTYALAHPVDDHAMQTSHVTRGEEWLPSAPRHVRIWDALGYPRPTFVHMPVILGADGGKLSKRHGAKFVLEYAEEGYLPDALFNFLTILGWALDDHTEIFSHERLIEVFELNDISVNPATFDQQKLEWMNGVYVREHTPEDELAEMFARRLERELPPDVPRPIDRSLVEEFAPLIRERVRLLSEVTDLVDFFFQPEVTPPPAEIFLQKRWKDDAEGAASALDEAAKALDRLDDTGEWAHEAIEAVLRDLADRLELKPGDLFTLCRLAVTGKRITPPLFETMDIVGVGPTVERLRNAASMLRETASAGAR